MTIYKTRFLRDHAAENVIGSRTCSIHRETSGERGAVARAGLLRAWLLGSLPRPPPADMQRIMKETIRP